MGNVMDRCDGGLAEERPPQDIRRYEAARREASAANPNPTAPVVLDGTGYEDTAGSPSH